MLAAGVSLALAATPVSGSISGEIVSTDGNSFVVRSSFGTAGDSTVSLVPSSVVAEQLSATVADLKRGACLTANGQKSTSGEVTAQRITITAAVKGKCSTGSFARGGDTRGGPPSGAASGTRPAGFTGFRNLGFADGMITARNGNTLTVHNESGSTNVLLSSSTQILMTRAVGHSAIKTDRCASVRGTSTNGGLAIKATNVELSTPSSSGCGGGFHGRP
jgi:hypothetical protein